MASEIHFHCFMPNEASFLEECAGKCQHVRHSVTRETFYGEDEQSIPSDRIVFV